MLIFMKSIFGPNEVLTMKEKRKSDTQSLMSGRIKDGLIPMVGEETFRKLPNKQCLVMTGLFTIYFRTDANKQIRRDSFDYTAFRVRSLN